MLEFLVKEAFEALDEEGYIIGKLNKKGEIIGLTIIDASQTKPKTSTT